MMATDLLASAASLLSLPRHADVKYLGFVHLAQEAPNALSTYRPGGSDVVDVNAMFDKKNIKRTRKMHPLFARGVPGLLNLEITAKSMRVLTLAAKTKEMTDTLIVDTPLHKIAFASSLKNRLFVISKRTGIDKYIAFVFETKNTALAADLAADLQNLSHHAAHARGNDKSTPERSARGQQQRPRSSLGLEDPFPSGSTQDGARMGMARDDEDESSFGFDAVQLPVFFSSLPGSSTNSVVTSATNSPLPDRRFFGSSTLSSWGSFESLSDLNPMMRSLSTHSLASIASVASHSSALNESFELASHAHSALCTLCESGDHKDWVRLPLCGHEFHAQCIRKFRVTHNLCPMCKRVCSHNLFSVKYIGAQFLHSLSPSESFSDVRTTCALTEQRCRHKRDVKMLVGRSDHLYLKFDSEPNDVYEEEGRVLPRVCFTKPLHELCRFDRTGTTTFALTFRASQASKSNGYLVQAFEVPSESDMNAVFAQVKSLLDANAAWWCTVGSEDGDEPGAPDE